MEKRKSSLLTAILLAIITVIYTVLVCVTDRKPIGPDGTVVGFAAMNGRFSAAVGVNLMWDSITDVMMALAILTAASFAVIGLIQLVRRKKLSKVDTPVIGLAAVYVVVGILYFAFDKIAINYRPFILPGESAPEPSFPSSHVMVVCTIMCTAIVAWAKLTEDNRVLYNVLRIAAAIIVLITVGGRIAAGVHWLTDIIAGVLYAATLTAIYVAVLDRIKQS